MLIGSVSMTLAPAMRLGWIVPPPHLLRAIAETKRDDDFGSAVMEQHALASWLESGQYDRHVRHARRSYAMRRATGSSRQLHQHFPQSHQRGIPAGLEILLELPDAISDRHVAAHARQQGLGVSPLSPMRISGAGPPGLVLSFARLAPRHSPEAVTRLELAVQAVLARGPLPAGGSHPRRRPAMAPDLGQLRRRPPRTSTRDGPPPPAELVPVLRGGQLVPTPSGCPGWEDGARPGSQRDPAEVIPRRACD